jgi:hypothetical protein
MSPKRTRRLFGDLETRLDAYTHQQKMSEWLKTQPAFPGAQGNTILDADDDIDDDGAPNERSALPSGRAEWQNVPVGSAPHPHWTGN